MLQMHDAVSNLWACTLPSVQAAMARTGSKRLPMLSVSARRNSTGDPGCQSGRKRLDQLLGMRRAFYRSDSILPDFGRARQLATGC